VAGEAPDVGIAVENMPLSGWYLWSRTTIQWKRYSITG
jgi:hypothetical protein